MFSLLLHSPIPRHYAGESMYTIQLNQLHSKKKNKKTPKNKHHMKEKKNKTKTPPPQLDHLNTSEIPLSTQAH